MTNEPKSEKPGGQNSLLEAARTDFAILDKYDEWLDRYDEWLDEKPAPHLLEAAKSALAILDKYEWKDQSELLELQETWSKLRAAIAAAENQA